MAENPEEFLARLGWFGTFVVADQSKHDAIVQSAKDKMVLIGSIFSVVCVLGFVGIVGLFVSLIRVLTGSLHSALQEPSIRHGVYAEVFALWLVFFILI